MKLWILQTGEPLHGDSENLRAMRAINLADVLSKRGHQVTIWSSQFNHQKKCFRNYEYKKLNKNIEICLIKSPGYKKNISLARLYDHFILAKNLREKLNKVVDLPDAVFIGFPPIETSYVMSKFLKKNKIPFLLDVKDLWPDIFVIRSPRIFKLITKLIFFPYFQVARITFKSANGITAMSNSFIERVLKKAKRKKRENDNFFPLVPNLNLQNNKDDTSIDEKLFWSKMNIYSDSSFKIIYVGSLSTIVTIDEILQAASILSRNKYNVKFIFCGDGENRDELMKKSSNYENIIFPGWVNQKQSLYLHKISQLSIIPYKNTEDFMLSLPNKTFDSISMNLPIFSRLKGEMKNFLSNHKIGYHYSNGQDLSDKISSLYNNREVLKKIASNTSMVYKKYFTYNIVYNNLADHLESIKK